MAEDAAGKDVPVSMRWYPPHLILRVSEADLDKAEFPVLIDPLATSPSWAREANLANELFGRSLSGAGDVDGDGYGDVVIGSFGYTNGQTVILPTCIGIQYSVTANGFTSGWKSKHVDCSDLEIVPADLCCMHNQLPPGLVAAGATVNIRNLGTGFKDCDCVCLPAGIGIQWSLTVNGFTSGWKSTSPPWTPHWKVSSSISMRRSRSKRFHRIQYGDHSTARKTQCITTWIRSGARS